MSSKARRRANTSRMVAGALLAGAAVPFAAAGTARVAQPCVTGLGTTRGLIEAASQLQSQGRSRKQTAA
jgi:hypothetical protein